MGARTTVLVVDDHAGVRRLLADALRLHLADFDPEVFQADGAAAALRWIGAVRPALVVADLWLPDPAGGLAFVRELKADPATAALPVLVLSATAPDLAAARAAGADAALAKPFRGARQALPHRRPRRRGARAAGRPLSAPPAAGTPPNGLLRDRRGIATPYAVPLSPDGERRESRCRDAGGTTTPEVTTWATRTAATSILS